MSFIINIWIVQMIHLHNICRFSVCWSIICIYILKQQQDRVKGQYTGRVRARPLRRQQHQKGRYSDKGADLCLHSSRKTIPLSTKRGFQEEHFGLLINVIDLPNLVDPGNRGRLLSCMNVLGRDKITLTRQAVAAEAVAVRVSSS